MEINELIKNGSKYGFYTVNDGSNTVIACTDMAEIDGNAHADYDHDAFINPDERYVSPAEDEHGCKYDIYYNTIDRWRKSEEAQNYEDHCKVYGKKDADEYARSYYRYFDPQKEDASAVDLGYDESEACDWDNPFFIRREDGMEYQGHIADRDDILLLKTSSAVQLMSIAPGGLTRREWFASYIRDTVLSGEMHMFSSDGELFVKETTAILTDKQAADFKSLEKYFQEFKDIKSAYEKKGRWTEEAERKFSLDAQRLSPELASYEEHKNFMHTAYLIDQQSRKESALTRFMASIVAFPEYLATCKKSSRVAADRFMEFYKQAGGRYAEYLAEKLEKQPMDICTAGMKRKADGNTIELGR